MIRFPTSTRPRASLLVTGWRSAPLLLGCLQSIARSVAGVDYEVILGLNAPTDELMTELDGHVSGAVPVTSAANRGFAGACNMASAHARGDYVVLMNDDTLVLPGWLETLVGAADQFERAGAVGGKVLNPDGSLQEAGALVWRDGTAAAVGGAVLPSEPRLLEGLRRVDYCGGEALLVRRATWDALGGMSDDYYPAYYEDLDLCLRIAARGEEVLCAPAATIVHLRSQSTRARFQAFLIERNRTVFVERWSSFLDHCMAPEPFDPEAVSAAIRAAAMPALPDARFEGTTIDRGTSHPPGDDVGWLRRELALNEEYAAHLESAISAREHVETAPAGPGGASGPEPVGEPDPLMVDRRVRDRVRRLLPSSRPAQSPPGFGR